MEVILGLGPMQSVGFMDWRGFRADVDGKGLEFRVPWLRWPWGLGVSSMPNVNQELDRTYVGYGGVCYKRFVLRTWA